MRKSTERKLKVYAVDAAMVFLAMQITAVTKADKRAEPEADRMYVGIEQHDIQDCGGGSSQLIYEDTSESTSLIYSRDWGSEDSEILMKIAMAEAEGERTEGKALVMLVVLNRAWSDGFPDTIEDVVFQEGQFPPVVEGGRYWTTTPDEDCLKALQIVQDGWDESQGALYFCSSAERTWMEGNTEYLFTEGNHKFYR